MFRKDGVSKKASHCNRIIFVLTGKMIFFPKSLSFLFKHKIKNDLSQNLHKNVSLFVCLKKMIFIYLINMILIFL